MQSQHEVRSSALLSLKAEISKDLVVNYIIDHLIDTDVFNEEEKTAILCSGQTVGSVRDLAVRDQILRIQSEKLIDLLREKMETKDFAFNHFIYILLKDGYYPWIGHKILHLVSQINTENEMLAHLSSIPSQLKEEEHRLEEEEHRLEEEEHRLEEEEHRLEEEEHRLEEEEHSIVVCNDVPNKVKNILNRCEKLGEIRKNLIRFGERGKGWLIINGMGGSGKTILAAESVRDWSCKHFKDGVWWTNCGQMTKDKQFDVPLFLIKMQLLWERITGRENIKFESTEMVNIKLKNHFKKYPKSLIVLDDVWNKEVLENFRIGVPIMVTTRDRGVLPFNIQDCDKHYIDLTNNEYGLSTHESRELLALWVNCNPNELNGEYVTKIIDKFKGNPLCLTLIGSFMEDFGNDPEYWQSLFVSVSLDNNNDFVCRGHTADSLVSLRRRASSGATHFLYNSFGFDILVRTSYEALSPELQRYYKYFALFIEDILIPIDVFQTMWDMSKLEVCRIMNQLVEKSLVMTLRANQITLYMVHDIILNFLKTQCWNELETLHSELLDSYLEYCRQENGSYKYSELPNDGYIWYYLGYHIYRSKRSDLFPKVFLDKSFVLKKIEYTGPSDLLTDYRDYRQNFINNEERYHEFVTLAINMSTTDANFQ